jgi:hypothetical protein
MQGQHLHVQTEKMLSGTVNHLLAVGSFGLFDNMITWLYSSNEHRIENNCTFSCIEMKYEREKSLAKEQVEVIGYNGMTTFFLHSIIFTSIFQGRVKMRVKTLEREDQITGDCVRSISINISRELRAVVLSKTFIIISR